jgi:hypothetical protein
MLRSHDEESLSIIQEALLLHFINQTSSTLADEKPMIEFWKQNASQIGLIYPFVLHLILALAAFHLVHEAFDGPVANPTSSLSRRSCNEWLSLASRHFTAGLTSFTARLSHQGPDNCGALYLGAMLIAYYTFAATPASANDLLVCTPAPCVFEEEQGSCVDGQPLPLRLVS